MFPTLLLGAAMLLVSNRAFSQSDEQSAYCTYVTQEAMAQRNLLRAPDAVAGIAQPNTGTAPQLYWGVSGSFANYSKAKLTLEAARKNCNSYRAATDATLGIRYALAKLEQEALRYRSELLHRAIEQLDLMVTHNLRILEVQNLTRPMLYSVQSIRARLLADRISTEMKLASLYVPDLISNVSLKQLVSEKQIREAEAQRSLALLDRQAIWDVRVTAGGRKRVSPFFSDSVEPYGEVAFSYNFGSRGNHNHLEKSAAAFATWKNLQGGETTRNAQILEQQIVRIIGVQQAELDILREQEKEIEANLQRLVGVDTASAVSFGNQLGADKLVLFVEIRDVTFRLQKLQDYLQSNF
jgi:hypothetical protein